MARNQARPELNFCQPTALFITVVFYAIVNQVSLVAGNMTVASQDSHLKAYGSSSNIIGRCNDAPYVRDDSGYPALDIKDMKVRFIASSSGHIARVTWRTPQVGNRSSVRSYWFTWLIDSMGLKEVECIILKNTTNSLDIVESPYWKRNVILEINIQPQPPKEDMTERIFLWFKPLYNDSSFNKLMTTSSKQPTAVTKRNTRPDENTTKRPTETNHASSLPSRQSSLNFVTNLDDDNGGDHDNRTMKIFFVCVTIATVAIMFMGIFLFCHCKRRRPLEQVLTEQRCSNDAPEKDYFYISYSPESEHHIREVADLTTWFRQRGYDVQMDIMQSHTNDAQLRELGRFRFGARQLGKAKNILMILSESYLNLCRLDEADESKAIDLSHEEMIVYSEIMQIRNELCSTVYRNGRFIPVLFGVKETDLPFWIKELVVYSWPEDKENNRLLYRLNDQTEYAVCREGNADVENTRPRDCKNGYAIHYKLSTFSCR